MMSSTGGLAGSPIDSKWIWCRPRSTSGMKLVQRAVHRLRERRQVARGVRVAEQAGPDLAVVVEQRNPHGLARRQRHLRGAAQHLPSHGEEGKLRTGHVSDHKVENQRDGL